MILFTCGIYGWKINNLIVWQVIIHYEVNISDPVEGNTYVEESICVRILRYVSSQMGVLCMVPHFGPTAETACGICFKMLWIFPCHGNDWQHFTFVESLPIPLNLYLQLWQLFRMSCVGLQPVCIKGLGSSGELVLSKECFIWMDWQNCFSITRWHLVAVSV